MEEKNLSYSGHEVQLYSVCILYIKYVTICIMFKFLAATSLLILYVFLVSDI
jgi:hypothetical protein